MTKFIINGGNKLKGEIEIEGAKNAILPALAASVLNGGKCFISNCPLLKDVEIMKNILMSIGCRVHTDGHNTTIDSSSIHTTEIPEDLVGEMRSSIILMGPMLTRFGNVRISFPGGCEIGPRPIDLHLKGLRAMGAKIHENHGFIYCESNGMVGADIHLDFPSVGATENIMLAAVLAEGSTYIRNAAKEPEIVDLQNMLNAMGAKVMGAGSSIIKIDGVKKLHDVEHYAVIPDRIVAGTYLCAVAMTGGNAVLKNTVGDHLNALIVNLRECGCRVSVKKNTICIAAPNKPKSIDIIRTLPFPGFPTDLQSQIVAVLSIAKGTSIVAETIFENRFKYVDELLRMGANIKVEGRLAVIKGVKKLTGAPVVSRDLRGGAALILAGLAAEGTTTVSGIHFVERGYEAIEDKLTILGADIKKVYEN